MLSTFGRLGKDTKGATMVEYVVILALIMIVAVQAWRTLGQNVNAKTQAAAQELQ